MSYQVGMLFSGATCSKVKVILPVIKKGANIKKCCYGKNIWTKRMPSKWMWGHWLKFELPCNRRMWVPWSLPSSHPWGLSGFLWLFSFLSSRWSPAATILHVNSGLPPWECSQVLLSGHWWPGKKIKYVLIHWVASFFTLTHYHTKRW